MVLVNYKIHRMFLMLHYNGEWKDSVTSCTNLNDIILGLIMGGNVLLVDNKKMIKSIG